MFAIAPRTTKANVHRFSSRPRNRKANAIPEKTAKFKTKTVDASKFMKNRLSTDHYEIVKSICRELKTIRKALATIHALPNVDEVIKKNLPICILSLAILASCEQMTGPFEEKSPASEENRTETPSESNPTQATRESNTSQVSRNDPEGKNPTANVIPSISRRPETPTFSPELLNAVRNWQAVPESVFPLGGITLKQPVTFQIRTASGQVIGNSPKAIGQEVTAVALRGEHLYVAPSKNSTQFAYLPIDQTDFKNCVAYLFEARKKAREAYNAKIATRKNNSAGTKERISLSSTRNSQNGRGTLEKTPQQGSLFEDISDIPPPMDFGHGKFCVCGECRQKRNKSKRGD